MYYHYFTTHQEAQNRTTNNACVQCFTGSSCCGAFTKVEQRLLQKQLFVFLHYCVEVQMCFVHCERKVKINK